MTASPQEDPQLGHSLWLQRRSSRRAAPRADWRSDWTPVGLVLLLMGLLILLSVFLPSPGAVERVKQAAQNDKVGSQRPPMMGALAEP